MSEKEVLVLCYWNGYVKYGLDGVYYEGSVPKKISVKQKTKLSRFFDGLHIITGFDKKKFKFELFGRYPFAVSPNHFRYLHLPVVNDIDLETMLMVPSNHSSINSVEFYLEAKPTSDVVDTAACLLENPSSSSKRPRIKHTSCEQATCYVALNGSHPAVKIEMDIQGVDNDNAWTEDERNVEFGNGSSITHGSGDGDMSDKNSGSNGVAQVINMSGDNHSAGKALNVVVLKKCGTSSASKPWSQSGLWVDDDELRVGLCFKDRDELKKVVDWCSIRGKQKCVVQETKKDEYTFECIRWKCNWSLHAARMEEHGLVEITKCNGPHTCCPIKPENFNLEFAAEQIECLIRVQPTLTIAELVSWWFEKFGYEVNTSEMKEAKKEVIKKLYGDWDQCFRVLPKLMDVFQSSNGLVVDWQYDSFPNREFASFRGVFWAFSQYIEGFKHCKPLLVVDTKDLNGKYPMKLMIASGVDAEDYYFPLAFAVTKEVSIDSWRWFLTEIREKVTQRKKLCLISSPNPDILTVINELWKEPWAYHRFCLDHLSSKFDTVFQNCRLKSLMKQAGSTKQENEFDSLMETIKKESPEAWRWLDQMPSHQWALAHDSGRRYGIMTIMRENLFQSFWSLGLPMTAAILLLFDELRLQFHQGIYDSRRRLNRGEMYTKPVMDKLEEFRTVSVTYNVMPLDDNAFQVTQPLQKNGWIVQLKDSSCTCGGFQVNKFPCMHALAVCEKLKVNPLQYVDDCYSIERLYRTYTAATFNSVPEVSAWPEASGVPTLFPPVLPSPRPPSNVSGKYKQKSTPHTIQKKKSSIFL